MNQIGNPNAGSLNWGLAGAPVDHARDFVDSFNLGQTLAAGPRNMAVNVSGAPPPTATGAGPVQSQVRAQGQPQAMDPQQRASAVQTTEQLGAILQGLWGIRNPDGTPDLQGRMSAARHIAQQSGLMDPAQITVHDMTDSGISQHAALVAAMRRQLAAGPPGPNIGDIEEGYRFAGGDPSNPNNWRTAQ